MAEISKIKLPSGTEYDIKDATARAAITGGMLAFIGKPSKLYSGDSGTTEVPMGVGNGAFTDGNTTVKRVKLDGAVNIRGTSYASGDVYTVQTGDTMIVGDAEYVAVSGTYPAWEGIDGNYPVGTYVTYQGHLWRANTRAGGLKPPSQTADWTDLGEIGTNGVSDSTIKWNEFGSTSSLGALAFKSSGSVTVTHGGEVDIHNLYLGYDSDRVTVSLATGADVADVDYTPSGTNSKPTLTKGTVTSTGSFTPAGTVTTATTENKTTTVTTGTVASGTPATYTPAGSVSQPTFTGTGVRLTTGNIPVPTSASFSGTEGNISVSGTPSGTVSQPTFSGSAMTSTGKFTPEGSVALTGSSTSKVTVSTETVSSSKPATYTPAGTITQPTISVATAGGTTTIKNPTSKTVVQSVEAYAPLSGSEQHPTGAVLYCEVSNETLTLKGIKAPTGASITTSNVTVKNGDASYTASGAAFTGTAARLITAALGYPTGATFTGTEGDVSVTGTPSGTVSQPTFSGSATTSTGKFTPAGSVSLTNTNKTATVSGTTPTAQAPATYTPEGTVSQPTFTGTAVRLVTGNIPVPKTYTFSGTAGSVSVTTTGAVTDVAAPTFTGDPVQMTYSVPTSGVFGTASLIESTETVDVDFS